MQRVDVIQDLGKYHRRIFVFLPENKVVKQLIYFHGTPEDGKGLAKELWSKIEERMRQTGTGLIMLEVENWNGDLSPWCAERVFPKGEDFSGGGREYLEDLCGQVIPELESRYQGEVIIERRIIGGYSMGGLFALYAICESRMFTDLISVSGSLWYDGMKEYVSEQMNPGGNYFERESRGYGERRLSQIKNRAYFSLGQKEPQIRNARMSRVGEQTMVIKGMLEQQGMHVHFEWNKGNHFQNVSRRIEKGIMYMLAERGISL